MQKEVRTSYMIMEAKMTLDLFYTSWRVRKLGPRPRPRPERFDF